MSSPGRRILIPSSASLPTPKISTRKPYYKRYLTRLHLFKRFYSTLNVTSPTFKDRDRRAAAASSKMSRPGFKRFSIVCAVFLAFLTVLMIFGTSHIMQKRNPFHDEVRKASLTVPASNSTVETINQSHVNTEAHFKDPPKHRKHHHKNRSRSKHIKSSSATESRGSKASPRLLLPFPSPLPSTHPCHSFSIPPPPAGIKKKSGFRPCPVCYLPVEAAIASEPPADRQIDEGVLSKLEFATSAHPSEQLAKATGKPPKFGGYPTWEDRRDSFSIKESMVVHCGFVWGEKPGKGTGYDISDADLADMEACRGIVVASAIFGAYDLLQHPSNISKHSEEHVCFIMFLDEMSWQDLEDSGTIPVSADGGLVEKLGIWRLVLVKNVPFDDPRRTGKIPKLLMHRLFPNARFSIWMDGKLKLVVDPYQVLERFLWRGNYTWAISKHYKRFDVFVEAEANKAASKYSNASIDEQIDVYQKDGLQPFSSAKSPIISDVPEGCLIIREHTPTTNLYSCLWFNEVDRFTSRDQLSFGYTRDKVLSQVPWRYTMFQDCERRNFVIQGYHKDVLKEKLASIGAPVDLMNTVKFNRDGGLEFKHRR